MARSILALAAVIFASASLFTTGAEACISCNYTPEVVNTPNPNAAKRNKANRAQVKRQRNPGASKSKTVRKQPAKSQPAKMQAKAQQKQPPVSEAVKAEPVITKEVATTETEKVETGPRLTGSSALMQHSIPKQEEPVTAADAEGACKKFIPAVGATVSVACE